MSHRLVVGVAALGLFALLIAFAIPPAIDATQSTENETVVVEENETVTVEDDLNVTLEESTDDGVTVSLWGMGVSLTSDVPEESTEDVTLDDEDVSVTVEDATTDEATLEVEHSATHGWDDGAKTLAGQMDVILLLFAFILILGGMGAVMS